MEEILEENSLILILLIAYIEYNYWWSIETVKRNNKH